MLLAAARARADDATAEFSATQNPSGPWGYGWEATPGGAFQAFVSHAGPTGVSAWSAANQAALEQGCTTVFQPDVTLTGAQLHARVGTGGAATVLRWTSPAAAAYHAHYFITSNLGYGFPPPGPLSVTGSQSQAEFGQVVIIAGDTNGDGFADVLVGQPHWSNGQTNEGRVLLYLGGPNGISSTPAWTWESNLAGAETGSALAAADVNGDGLMDLIVGSPGENSSAGHVDVFYSTSLGPPSTPNWTFDGAATGGRFAASLAAGDFNADGYGDFAAGSPLRNSAAGLIQFWRGGPAGLGASQRGADVSMSPPLGTGQYGAALAFVGDVDGDGYNDLVAGGPNATGPGGLTNAGAVYYFRGSVVGPSASPNVVSFGITNQHLGDAVAGVGDVDGDGHPDVLAGSSATPNGAIPQAGAVSLLRGSAFGMQTGPTWIVWGQVANGHLGKSVAGPGDLDGDGFNDMVAGEPGWNNGTTGEGRVMVFKGGANPATTPAWQLDSNQLNAAQGTAVGAGPPGGGDVNGDGTPDFVLGTPLWDTVTTDAGRVTLVMNSGPPPVAPQKLRATLRSTLGVLATGTLDTSTGADTLTFDLDVSPAAGVPLDLELTDTDGNVVRDVVSVDAIVAPTGPPGQAFGPAYPLAGRRYAQRLGPPAFDGAAFDPRARTFASNGHLYDVCGDLLAPGPGGAGIAWDPVTQAFWSIAYDAGNARWVVSSWDTTSHTSTPVL
ncbi:MAG TPA: VCBS repeat-containing protein, partial [Candidatus Eisenbacteria bacterium]|nr:VCBS repeat-containing protein [Candidatus Eisenbacteria bacterium]